MAANMLGGRTWMRAASRADNAIIRSRKSPFSARSLSYIASRPVLSGGNNSNLRLKATSHLPSASLPGLSFARFNSTSTTPTTTAGETLLNPQNASLPGNDTLAKIEEIPERIGYLKELGLDYGWGPSSFMEWFIEHIHIYSSLPWWASIAAAGLLVRLAIFHPSIKAADNAARTGPLKDQILELRKLRMLSLQQGRHLEASKAKVDLDELYKTNDIKMWRNFVPLIQIPLGFGTFRVLRGMSELPVPAYATEQIAWIQDMTSSDPYFVLPILTTAFLYLSLKTGFQSAMGSNAANPMGRFMMYGFPTLSLLFTVWQPAGLQLYFFSTGFFALCQSYLINMPTTRKLLGIAPMHRPAESKDSLRMIQQEYIPFTQGLQAGTEVSAAPKKPGNVSLVDKVVNNAKKEFSTMKQEMNKGLKNFAQQDSSTNADGSPMAPPRLSPEEKRSADTYKAQREIEDVQELAERNRRRVQEYEAFIAQQQMNASQAWRKKAKEATASKKPAKKSRTKK